MLPRQAVNRGLLTIYVPSMAVLLTPMLALIAAHKYGFIPSTGLASAKWAIPTFLVSFVGGWLVWSVQVPKWRLWAYAQVDDIDALLVEAAEAQLIWPEGSCLQRTEIASAETWKRIRALEAAKRGSDY